MHELTDAEARVIWSMLNSSGETERERLRQIDLPSSTYHAIRRRAYSGDWLKDRYLPDPVRFGRPVVSFLLARPYAERTEELVERWKTVPGAVVLWHSPQMLFGVFFHSTVNDARRVATELADPSRIQAPASAIVDLTEASVPVFFDFVGAWSHLAGIDLPSAYPFSLGLKGPLLENERRLPIAPHVREWARELSSRPFEIDSAGRVRQWLGMPGIGRGARHLMERGWVEHRVYPSPASLPAYHGRYADQMIFVSGELLPGIDPTALLAALRHPFRICPFLFAYDGPRLLFAFLAQSEAPAPGLAPPVPFHALVSGTLSTHLRRIDILRESVYGMSAALDHRYDRMLAPEAGPARSRPVRALRRIAQSKGRSA